MGHWGTCLPRLPTISFLVHFNWSKSDSQLSKYCIVCEINWCKCQQLTALSISTALVTTHPISHRRAVAPGRKFAVSAPWHNFQLCPSSQQVLTTPLVAREDVRIRNALQRAIFYTFIGMHGWWWSSGSNVIILTLRRTARIGLNTSLVLLQLVCAGVITVSATTAATRFINEQQFANDQC